VEDDPNLRLLACNLLQRGGYTVLAAANGPAALELWQEHRRPIDLLLTDMVMPDGVTGRQLAEKLQHEKQDLKIVYTSGYSTDIIRQDMPLVEGINFLQKPYPSAKLTQTVRRCLDQK
jgi:CheY-like chemotaxis protein